MNQNYGTNLLIKKVYSGIQNQENVSYFEEIYFELFKRSNFPVRTLENQYFYRARPFDFFNESELFSTKKDLQYPPISKCKKGRLNDIGEQLTYLSNSELGTIIELKDINYSDIFCIAKIECIQKDTYYHFVGIDDVIEYKLNRRMRSDELKIFNLVKDLLKTNEANIYNSTIAMWHEFNRETIVHDRQVDVGMAYISTQSSRTNKKTYNIVVTPKVFDLKFRFLEASYYFLRENKEREEIELFEINYGNFNSCGELEWEKSIEDMMFEYKKHK